MYKIKEINPEVLDTIEIKNQSEIVRVTGEKLDLKKAYEIIRKESNDFTEENEKALKADTLFAELLQRYGVLSKDANTDDLELQEQEQLAILSLLELELKLAININ